MYYSQLELTSIPREDISRKNIYLFYDYILLLDFPSVLRRKPWLPTGFPIFPRKESAVCPAIGRPDPISLHSGKSSPELNFAK